MKMNFYRKCFGAGLSSWRAAGNQSLWRAPGFKASAKALTIKIHFQIQLLRGKSQSLARVSVKALFFIQVC